MKNINKILVIIVLTITTFGCSDDYFDVDKPSQAQNFENLALKDMLTPSIYYTFRAQSSAATSIGMFSQHIGSAFTSLGPDNHLETTNEGVWNDLYLRSMLNVKQLEKKAILLNATHYKGISHVLLAINLGLATDSWGNIPYSEAFMGSENLTPKYDSQQAIYAEINNLLTLAISELAATDSSVFQPGSDDLVYNGSLTKWIKAAYSFRARYAMHLSEIQPNATTYNQVLSDAALGFSANTDDFQLVYNDRNLNPWYASQLGLNTGNAAYLISKQFISNLNGVNFPYSTITMDPRMLKIIDIRNYPNPTASSTNLDPNVVTNYKGTINGTGGKYTIAPSVAANAKIGIDFAYSRANSPVVISSYSELQFLIAEAEFLKNGGTTVSAGTTALGNTAYLNGIGANMDKLGVSGTDKVAYLSDTSINLGMSGLQLKNIMREKNTTLFLTTESFNDLRRYDFSTTVFPGLTLPINAPAINSGQWVRRLQYPTSEANTNPVNYSQNKQAVITSKVWWDL